MGILADFLAAPADQALAYQGKRVDNVAKTHLRHMRNLMHIEMACLLAVVDPTVGYTTKEFPMVKETGQGAVIWFRISPKLVEALAAAKPDDLAAWADAWSRTEHMAFGTWKVDNLRSVLDDLHTLCVLAVKEQVPVHLWNCI
jgi:hypothetical protein